MRYAGPKDTPVESFTGTRCGLRRSYEVSRARMFLGQVTEDGKLTAGAWGNMNRS